MLGLNLHLGFLSDVMKLLASSFQPLHVDTVHIALINIRFISYALTRVPHLLNSRTVARVLNLFASALCHHICRVRKIAAATRRTHLAFRAVPQTNRYIPIVSVNKRGNTRSGKTCKVRGGGVRQCCHSSETSSNKNCNNAGKGKKSNRGIFTAAQWSLPVLMMDCKRLQQRLTTTAFLNWAQVS